MLYLSALFTSGVFWYRALRALGQDVRFFEAMRAYYVGHLGKYVPGKALVVILRTALVRSRRVDTGIAAASVFLETLTWIAVGSFLAAAYLAVHFRHEPRYLLGAIGLMLVASLPTCPPIFVRLARRAGVGRSNAITLARLHQLDYRTIASGWILMGVGWTLMGLTLWATLRAMAIPMVNPVSDIPLCVASAAMATVAGFVVLFIPGGLGVREATLVILLSPYLAETTPHPELLAWVIAALFRMVSMVSEVAISGILYVAYLRKRDAHP